MAVLKIHRLENLPAQLNPNTIYLVNRQTQPQRVELYVTDNTSTIVKSITTDSGIQAIMNSYLLGVSELVVVDNIATRDNLNPTGDIAVLVVDASNDPEVGSGSALYLYDMEANRWVKTTEYRDIDMSVIPNFNWEAIEW